MMVKTGSAKTRPGGLLAVAMNWLSQLECNDVISTPFMNMGVYMFTCATDHDQCTGDSLKC